MYCAQGNNADSNSSVLGQINCIACIGMIERAAEDMALIIEGTVVVVEEVAMAVLLEAVIGVVMIYVTIYHRPHPTVVSTPWTTGM